MTKSHQAREIPKRLGVMRDVRAIGASDRSDSDPGRDAGRVGGGRDSIAPRAVVWLGGTGGRAFLDGDTAPMRWGLYRSGGLMLLRCTSGMRRRLYKRILGRTLLDLPVNGP